MNTHPHPHPHHPSHPVAPGRSRTSRIALTCLAGLALLVSACNVATSQKPIGARPAAVRDLHPEGIWRNSDGQVFFVRIADEAAGRLEIATVERNDKGFQLDRTEVLLRQEGETVLANFHRDGSAENGDYTFGRLLITGDTAILHLAGPQPIRDFARNGNGEVGLAVTTNSDRVGGGEQVSVVVTTGFGRLAAELAGDNGWRLLDMQNPVILMRQRPDLN